MRLALFDLDHTLIPFDSGMAWTRFLVRQGHLPAQSEADYLGYAHQYVAGTLDIHAMHRACVAPLGRVDAVTLSGWISAFHAAMAPRVPAAMRALVDAHRAAGDLCAIVTATTRPIATAFAALFGVPHLLCTEPVFAPAADGSPRLTGEIAGVPCFRGHKLDHVEAWLARLGHAPLAQAAHSVFYSDSASDLPLLQAVREPVAVSPDARLLAHAQTEGWRVIA
ncbi:MAG: HAD family hydrolase [Leptothrix sp. (in: b-proteobacteria)]